MASPRPSKFVIFVLEGLNSLATTYYFFYIYFFAESQFGFDKKQNLLLAAFLGLVYAGASVFGGRIAQRRGYLNALGLGSLAMGAGQILGARSDSLLLHGITAVTGIIGMGMTWPSLQALASDGEKGPRLQRMVGIYNLVWSGGGAVAYLTGGALIESWGPRSTFVLPAALNVVLIALILWCKSRRPFPSGRLAGNGIEAVPVIATATASTARFAPETFLRMAWFANPFAYLAINTVVAFGPALANSLSLSPRYAGYFCSVWMFMRTGAFVLLWLWPGWHYRFRWLLAAYGGMLLTFIGMLLAPSVAALVAAQLGFGLCVGLIYYSSLYYSMDVGETKGEHGGIHEAAIGLGLAAGPGLGATVLYLAPQLANGTAKAVGALLAVGFGGLVWLGRRK